VRRRVRDTRRKLPNVLSARNADSFNLGNTAGVFLRGAAHDLRFGIGASPVVAAIAALFGLAAAVYGAPRWIAGWPEL
jgi:predicted MFS family arabinose efflux permease